MPSSTILNYALDRIMEKNPQMIAPQHGSIIKKEMIIPVVNRLRKLECGLYLLQEEGEELPLLDRLDKLLKKLTRSIIAQSNFKLLLGQLFLTLKEEIPEFSKACLLTESLSDDKKLLIEVTENRVEIKLVPSDYRVTNFTFKELLETEKRKIGYLSLFSSKNLDRKQLKFLELLFRHIKYPLSASLEREFELEVLKNKSRILEEMAAKDPLTGLFNRYYLGKCIKGACQKPISIIIFDLDHFKKINDTYGHRIGDCVLKEFARILKESFRNSDCLIRYGGEEFLVVLNRCDLEMASKKAEEVREKVEKHPFCKEEGLNLKVTVSAGVREILDPNNFKEEFDKADKALYRAKEEGRNRVVCV